MLTLARESIGKLHRYDTSGKIQEYNVVNISGKNEYLYDRVALCVLQQALLEASYAIVHTDGNMYRGKNEMIKHSKEALAFISGTGFNVMFETYGIGYNADEVRNQFYARFRLG